MSAIRVMLSAVFAGLFFVVPLDATAAEKRILVFGDSNTWGWVPVREGLPTTRYPDDVRWPGILAEALGSGVTVVVDALSGRTVDVAYPSAISALPGAAFDGAAALPATIASETPVDLVVVMLGTNDLRSDLNRTPDQIANGLRRLAQQGRSAGSGVFTTYVPPRFLIVVPPSLGDVSGTPIGISWLARGRNHLSYPRPSGARFRVPTSLCSTQAPRRRPAVWTVFISRRKTTGVWGWRSQARSANCLAWMHLRRGWRFRPAFSTQTGSLGLPTARSTSGRSLAVA